MLSIDLHGQVAVVTGGSRGIGAATVKLLSQAGAAVAFSYHANRAAAEAVIAACPRPAIALPGDAADPAVAAATSRFGRLDIAVANAGIWNADDIALENLTPEQWDETVNCNLRGVYAL